MGGTDSVPTNWDGSDPTQQPLLPGIYVFRCFTLTSTVLMSAFFGIRCWTLTRIDNPATILSFVAEVYLYLNMLLATRLAWAGHDTQYKTPDYSVLRQSVTKDAPADEQPVLLKAMPGQNERENYPSVAILIPTYNEEREILEPVVKAAYELDWPEGKVGVYVCDDGGRDWVKSGCPLRGAAAARSSRRSMASVTCVLCALWVPWGLRSEERGTFT